MVTHKLSPPYLERRERFGVTFPAAYEFLTRLEAEGPPLGLWLSTATNAHLYKGAAFIAYIKVHSPEQGTPSLVWSPHYHLRIADGTKDESSRLFTSLFGQLLTAHEARRGTWARRQAGGATELAANTPRELFSGLFDTLRRL